MPAIERRTASPELLILIVGITLRLALGWYNHDANDPHLPVILSIAEENRIPRWNEMWEAYQPKAYYVVVALVLKIVRSYGDSTAVHAAQAVSTMASIGTLFVVSSFLKRIDISPRVRALTLALIATSPGLIGIGAQATNDSFVILFGSLSLLAGFRYLNSPSWSRLGGFGAATILAGISKGNGLVMLAVSALIFAVSFIKPPPGIWARRMIVAHGSVFLVISTGMIGTLGSYIQLARETGTPFANGWEHSGLLKHPVIRPGLTTPLTGLATFRFVDLLAHPKSTDSRSNYPVHRTSLWSRVYAQSVFVQFESWPKSWETFSPTVLALGRLLFVIALVPLVAMLYGLITGTVTSVRSWWESSAPAGGVYAQLFIVIAAFAYLLFVALYSMKLRDYSTMKAIFIYPATVAFAWSFAIGAQRSISWKRFAGARPVCAAVCWAVVVCSAADVLALCFHLWRAAMLAASGTG